MKLTDSSGLAVLPTLKILHLAGRKRQRWNRGKLHNLRGRRDEQAHRIALWIQAFQQTHGLEEPDRVRLFLQHLAHLIEPQIRGLYPAFGGHSPSGSFLWLVRAASWQKLLIEV